MPRVKAAVSRERELIVLSCIRSRLGGPDGAIISITGIARETELTVHQARAALRRLTRDGLIRAGSRTYPDGVSAANSYRLTQAGFDALAKDPQIAPPAAKERNTNR